MTFSIINNLLFTILSPVELLGSFYRQLRVAGWLLPTDESCWMASRDWLRADRKQSSGSVRTPMNCVQRGRGKENDKKDTIIQR